MSSRPPSINHTDENLRNARILTMNLRNTRRDACESMRFPDNLSLCSTGRQACRFFRVPNHRTQQVKSSLHCPCWNFLKSTFRLSLHSSHTLLPSIPPRCDRLLGALPTNLCGMLKFVLKFVQFSCRRTLYIPLLYTAICTLFFSANYRRTSVLCCNLYNHPLVLFHTFVVD